MATFPTTMTLIFLHFSNTKLLHNLIFKPETITLKSIEIIQFKSCIKKQQSPLLILYKDYNRKAQDSIISLIINICYQIYTVYIFARKQFYFNKIFSIYKNIHKISLSKFS